MASTSGPSTVAIIPIFILIIAIINTVIVSGVREGELTVMFGILRARGYHLFANAIATSDIHYDLKSDGNFTLFAPINSALFALDMTMAASNYVTTLRYHVVPRRMSIVDLLSLPPASNSIPTLVPGQDLLVEQRRSLRSLITVGGVDIVVPGMFYGRNIAVHGLDGILEYRPHTRNSPANLTVTGASLSNLSGNLTYQSPITDLPNNSTQEPSFSPLPPVYNISGNYTFQFPVAIQSPPSSDLTRNQTVTSAVSAPDTSPMSDRIDKHLSPSRNQMPIHSASFDFTSEEHMSRAKLLELSSYGSYDVSPATEPTSNRLQQFTPVDDKTLDCSLADNGGDQHNTAIHPQKINITSNMICAQK